MSKFDEVTRKLRGVPYMNERQAKAVRTLIEEIDAEQVLELGFFRGKSTCYMAAMLEDRASEHGHITTIDTEASRNRHSTITENLATLGLSHRVTPIFAHRSFTWEMARMLKQSPRPQFDFCYVDGGHTWDVTGFAFLLVDMLLRPGGIILLDDLNWTIRGYVTTHPASARTLSQQYDADEMDEPGVRLVWNTIVPHLGYARTEFAANWGIARKPARPS